LPSLALAPVSACGPAVSRPYETYASFYDTVQGNAMLPLLRRNFDHLVARYRVPFRSVADVACGTGGFLRHLARLGVTVLGVDRSRAMLRLARRKNPSPRVLLLRQDMRALRLPFAVDLITCNFDSLNYLLSLRDLATALRAFRRNLVDGGHLLFDMVTDAWPEPAGDRVASFRLPRGSSVWRVSWDPRTRLRRVHMKNQLASPDGGLRSEREVHLERAYPVRDVRRVLGRCGFRSRGVLDARSLQPARDGTRRALYLATTG
jgi:SAM-dependent methyltransferase